MITYKNVWYFWHTDYPEYNERMHIMARFCYNPVHVWLVDSLTLAPKE